MYGNFKKHLQLQLSEIEEAGLYKKERVIVSPQNAQIKVNTGQDVLNFCANNYLGLSDHPRLVSAAKNAMDSHVGVTNSFNFFDVIKFNNRIKFEKKSV